MNILELTSDTASLQFSRDEFGILRGCAIHVLEEFAMGKGYDLTAETGWELEHAITFKEKIRLTADTSTDSIIIYKLQNAEILYLIRIIADAIKYIDWEFQTLTGYTLDEADRLLQELRQIY